MVIELLPIFKLILAGDATPLILTVVVESVGVAVILKQEIEPATETE